MAQEEKPTPSAVEETSSKSSSLAISTRDRWFTQFPVVAARSQFTSHNLYIWERHIQAILRLRELVDNLKNIAPPKVDPNYK